MISYTASWPPPKKLLRRYGVMDFLKLNQKAPDLDELQEVLPDARFDVIQECCAYADCDVGQCDDGLCPNCMNRTRFGLIQKGAQECFDHRLRACLVTIIKKEWETPLERLQDCNADLIVDEALISLRVLDADFEGPILAIGGIDLSLNECRQPKQLLSPAERKLNHVWAPHLHMVLIARDPEALASGLKSQIEGVQVPDVKHFRCDKSYCLGRSIAYATALKPERRELGVDKRGNATRKPRPLAIKPRAEALQWLATAKQRIFTHYKP